MAPGIGDGWPEIIPAPHTPNARLKRMDGDPVTEITALRQQLAEREAELAEARAVVVKLWDLLDDIDTLDDAAGSDDAGFRKRVYEIQRRRFGIVDLATVERYTEAARTGQEGE